jgi:hypothetical protein
MANMKELIESRLYKVATALFDCSPGTISIDIDSAKLFHIITILPFYLRRLPDAASFNLLI